MPLFQCSECGCIENTALSYYWLRDGRPALCSVCDPYIGRWHGRFPRSYLPHGEFVTNRKGNLEHKKTKAPSEEFEREVPWPKES